MFSSLFHTILYQPIFNLFVWLYDILPGHDVGVVVLIITILVRLLVYPLVNSSLKAQKSLQTLQPKMEEVKKQYANDQQKQAQAMMELYKNNKVNPFSSCLPLLIQLPVLIALYMVLRDGLTSANLTKELYSFVADPGKINTLSFGFLEMSKPNIVLAVLAALSQYWQAKMMTRKSPPPGAGAGAKDEGMAAMMNKQMLYFMPFLTLIICLSLPSGLALYWFFGTVLMGLQQILLFRKDGKKDAQPPASGVIEGQVVK